MSEQPVGNQKRVGRPRAPEPRACVSTWLPSTQHDRLIAIARQRGTSVSSVVRGAVALFVISPSAIRK